MRRFDQPDFLDSRNSNALSSSQAELLSLGSNRGQMIGERSLPTFEQSSSGPLNRRGDYISFFLAQEACRKTFPRRHCVRNEEFPNRSFDGETYSYGKLGLSIVREITDAFVTLVRFPVT